MTPTPTPPTGDSGTTAEPRVFLVEICRTSFYAVLADTLDEAKAAGMSLCRSYPPTPSHPLMRISTHAAVVSVAQTSNALRQQLLGIRASLREIRQRKHREKEQRRAL